MIQSWLCFYVDDDDDKHAINVCDLFLITLFSAILISEFVQNAMTESFLPPGEKN